MSEALLTVEGLNAFYGPAQVLRDVSFAMGDEPIAIVGRNGMGKTTLCAAIVGMTPPRATGSIRFAGKELIGKPSYRIARQGIGYVPQGRRLFPSLSVDEHLRMVEARRGDSTRWTVDRVYELFPRLAERKRNGGAQLSGGEQQIRQQRSLASREAGRRLVEHQDLRVGRERHRERDLAVLAVRERADELVELVGDCDATRGRARPLAELLVPLGDDDGPQAAARDAEHGEIDVVLDAETGKEPRLLVGAREP